MDPRLMSLLGDKRFKCFVNVLKGRGCDMLNVDPDKLLSGDRAEVEKVYKFLPELDSIRKSGYDIIGKLIELAGKLRSENVSDMATAFAIMFATMFGRSISEEDVKKVGSVIDAFKCVNFDEDGISVDNECLNSVDVPEEFKNQLRMIPMVNLVWSA